MKSIQTEAYENLGKNMPEEELLIVLKDVDHKILLKALDIRLNRGVRRDNALDELVAEHEK